MSKDTTKFALGFFIVIVILATSFLVASWINHSDNEDDEVIELEYKKAVNNLDKAIEEATEKESVIDNRLKNGEDVDDEEMEEVQQKLKNAIEEKKRTERVVKNKNNGKKNPISRLGRAVGNVLKPKSSNKKKPLVKLGNTAENVGKTVGGLFKPNDKHPCKGKFGRKLKQCKDEHGL